MLYFMCDKYNKDQILTQTHRQSFKLPKNPPRFAHRAPQQRRRTKQERPKVGDHSVQARWSWWEARRREAGKGGEEPAMECENKVCGREKRRVERKECKRLGEERGVFVPACGRPQAREKRREEKSRTVTRHILCRMCPSTSHPTTALWRPPIGPLGRFGFDPTLPTGHVLCGGIRWPPYLRYAWVRKYGFGVHSVCVRLRHL